jgi:5,10-methylene-tetrahydrofolate dehydrogenase/methenyl tetrahydrofolate cyclohydrolase
MKKTRPPHAVRASTPAAAAAPLDTEPRPFTLLGRTALVTGSSKGLGKAMALALGAAGAKVAINYAHGRDAA